MAKQQLFIHKQKGMSIEEVHKRWSWWAKTLFDRVRITVCDLLSVITRYTHFKIQSRQIANAFLPSCTVYFYTPTYITAVKSVSLYIHIYNFLHTCMIIIISTITSTIIIVIQKIKIKIQEAFFNLSSLFLKKNS